MVDNFFEELNKITNSRKRIGFIFNHIDNNLLDDSFDQVDEILNEIKVNEFSISDLLAFLTITAAAKEILKTRVEFVQKVQKHFDKVDPERADKLLSGLE